MCVLVCVCLCVFVFDSAHPCLGDAIAARLLRYGYTAVNSPLRARQRGSVTPSTSLQATDLFMYVREMKLLVSQI